MTLNRRSLLSAAGALGLGAGAGAVALWPALGGAQPLTVDAVLNDPDAPVQGNPGGDVTLVEFFDYQCPFCKRMHPMLEDVVTEDGGVRLVMKDWPIFGPPSLRASQLALGAVALGAYPDVNRALMATEARLDAGQVDAAVASVVPVRRAMDAYRAARGTWDALLDRNDAQATALGFRGTPAFAIGTTLYAGALDRATLRAAISTARAET
ncbi:DsbA family protein [Roseivivax isoporae]|uniref:DSBA oxidoreductase n=1 Tax=Roseivivax isoporae LMG 25204 TaxID=1449351 RepID=X7F4S6_9RHOB|nr:DsbA family protein [Roseivivax isoporae]ETX27039.1 DSBA oxidoreductase [Roseivivax isoporae LMG 25204]